MLETLAPLFPAALTLGALHALAPDHWVPFAAVGRAREWSAKRTAGVTALCGLAHVTVSAVFALAALKLGQTVLAGLGESLATGATLALLLFGTAYAVWGLYRATHRRLPGLGEDGADDTPRLAVPALAALFALDPCVPLLPLAAAAAAAHGVAAALAVTAVYAAATLTVMIALAVPARLGAGAFQSPIFDRWGDALAGGVIVLVALAVQLAGV